MKHLILLAFTLLAFASSSFAQTEPPIDSTLVDSTEMVFIDSIIFQSPNRIAAEASCAIRYASNADIYVRWSDVPNATGYTLRYSFGGTQTTWTAIQASSNEFLIEGIPLDTSIIWEVIPLGISNGSDWLSDVTPISTAAQEEPINVARNFYNWLEAWFAKENNEESFCEFMGTITEVSIYEKLSFLQAYGFDNAIFVKPLILTSDLDAWFPENAVFGEGEGEWCMPVVVGSCRCKVISRGTNFATPNFPAVHF